MAESSKKLYTFDVCEVDDSGILCISLKEANEGFSACSPFEIHQFLLNSECKNQHNGHTIIEAKDEYGSVIYHFHCGLKILGDSVGNFPIPFCVGSQMGSRGGSEFHKNLFCNNVTFSDKVVLKCAVFQGQANFNGSKFEKQADFSLVEFRNYTFFDNVTFQSKADFSFASFSKDSRFYNTTFKAQATFEATDFLCSAYFLFITFHKDTLFIDANFKEMAIFTTSVFHKYACFYGTTFTKPPNFTRAVFGSELNLVNSKLQCGFYEVEEFLKERGKHARPKVGINLESRLSQFTNDYRDSFRLMKNALLKGNNALDASIYHRAELYCKEIELKYKDKNSKTFRDRVDQYVLKFYRHTSDHHTDLLKILSWIIVAIGILEAHNHDRFFSYLAQLKQIEDWQTCLMGVFYILIFGGLLIWILKRLLLKFKSIPILILKVFNKTFQILLPARTFIQIKTKLCRFLQSCCRIYNILRLCISLFVVIAMIYTQPKYILGIGSFFGANRSGWENLLIVTYSIIMFLLLFSLQKTARKNSIVVT